MAVYWLGIEIWKILIIAAKNRYLVAFFNIIMHMGPQKSYNCMQNQLKSSKLLGIYIFYRKLEDSWIS